MLGLLKALIRPFGPTSPSGRSAEGLALFQWGFVGWCELWKTLIRPFGLTSPSGRSGEGLGC